MGVLELQEEWTESEIQEAEGFIWGGSFETSFKEDLFNKVEAKLDLICNERLVVEGYLKKAISDYPGDVKLLELHKNYAQIFKQPMPLNDEDVSVEDDGNGEDDDDDDGNGEDDNDEGNGDDDDDDDDDQDGNDRVTLDDFGNKPFGGDPDAKKRDDTTVVDQSEKKKDDAVPEKQVDPSNKETCEEEEYEITSTPETLMQWLENNLDTVDEVIKCIAAEYSYLESLKEGVEGMTVVNPGTITPEKMATRASNVCPSPEKRLVKPSSYLLSPYMNKKTKIVPKITRLEFVLENSFFVMQGDKIESF